MTSFTESIVEEAALAWLESIGWQVANGPDIAPDMPAAERADYGEVVLAQRVRDALARLNPALPADALEDAFRNARRDPSFQAELDGLMQEMLTSDQPPNGRTSFANWLDANQHELGGSYTSELGRHFNWKPSV